jgi:hypothetical protein
VGDASRNENWHSGYPAVATLQAGSQVNVAAAGLVAYKVNGPVAIAAEIRVQDVLSGSPVDRDIVRNDSTYVEADEWSQAWKEASRTLPENRVVIVVAPRGYGSTAFSLRLLACHAAADAELVRLEADWMSPKINKLPLQRNCAYQLDLQDPDHDRFDGAFLNGLGKYSAELKALGSYLVLAVADELWPSHHGQVSPAVTVLRLEDPPDALELVENHLAARGFNSAVAYVRQPEAAKHIRGRDAVQAMRAVEVVIQQLREYGYPESKTGQRAEVVSLAPDAALSESGRLAPEPDPKLSKAIEQALGDWQEDLDGLFDERGRDTKNDRTLSPEDRCLLMSLAMHQTGAATEIESAAFALEQALAKIRLGAPGNATDTWDVLSRRGLRPRLRAFHAAIDGRDKVTFKRPGYAEAVLAYVWDNYSGLRDDVVTWMVSCAATDTGRADPAAETLTSLILRLQDTERLTSLRDSAIAQGRRDVIIRVMTAAATDEHMGRRARSFLYDWASQRPEIQHVVIAVCRTLIGVKDDMALVRLRRVANHATDVGVRAQVLAVFRDMAADMKFTPRFAEAVAAWQHADPASRAVKLGLLALLTTETDGIPWISSHATAIDVSAGIRALLADLDSFPETVPTVVSWMRSCAPHDIWYASARNLLVGAIRNRHAFSAGMTVMKELAEVKRPDGTSAGEDIYGEIVEPELRSLNPLTKSET